MEVLLFAIAVLFATLCLGGFAVVLLGNLIVSIAMALGGLFAVGSLAFRLVPGLAVVATRGILAIEGLASDQARRLRRELAQVLRRAPPDSVPRACACVKQVDGAFVGVLRIFNRKGHYLLRAPGGTVAAVAHTFSATLADFGDRFPVEAGTPRVECPECDPRTCPYRRHGRFSRDARIPRASA